MPQTLSKSTPATPPSLVSKGLQHRPDIDGLRAVAVMAVVLFHAFPNKLRGGFTGVDIFFVISGFLISSIILKDLDVGQYSLARFYSRRIRRIFPALITILASTFAFGWYVLLQPEFRALAKHLVSSTLFVSNFTLWLESGYFDVASDTKPLLHLWSLAIEEQFYIIWPPILFLAWKLRQSLTATTIALGSAFFAVSLFLTMSNPTAAYFMPISRFWELLIGALLAILMKEKSSLSILPRTLQSILGTILLSVGIVLTSKDSSFPGWWALLPTVGTFLLIAAGSEAWINKHILAHKSMSSFGLISYPLYLWHWPVLVFLHISHTDPLTKLEKVAAIVGSVLLAWATYQFVEKPLRFGSLRKSVVPGLTIGVAILSLIGILSYFELLRVRNDDPLFTQFISASEEWEYPGPMRKMPQYRHGVYQIENPGPYTTLFLGDSHLEQYSTRISSISDSGHTSPNSVVFITNGGCPPIPNVLEDHPNHKLCEEVRNTGFEFLKRDEVRTVVIGGCWNCYFVEQVNPVTTSPEDYQYYTVEEGKKHYFRNGSGSPLALRNLEHFLASIKGKKKVYLLLDNPSSKAFAPQSYFSGGRLGRVELKPMPDSLPMDPKQRALYGQLASIAARQGIEVLDPVRLLCSENQCMISDSAGNPIFTDGNHLRPKFVRDRANFMDKVLF